MQITYMVYV